ncbi:MAG: retropepsin-like aspartic protease [Hyphomonas sp.]
MRWTFREEGPDLEFRAGQLAAKGPIVPIVITGPGGRFRTSGLIDTGATFCAIKPKLAKRLALKIVDRKRISGVAPSGTGSQADGEADVAFGMVGLQDPPHDLPLQLIVADFLLDAPSMSLLLGRSFLQNFDLFYEGSCGRFTLTRASGALHGLDD